MEHVIHFLLSLGCNIPCQQEKKVGYESTILPSEREGQIIRFWQIWSEENKNFGGLLVIFSFQSLCFSFWTQCITFLSMKGKPKIEFFVYDAAY